MNYVALATALGIHGNVVGDEFRARCPLHQDRSPSFSMNIETGMSICFRGCYSGDFPHLVERILDCSLQEAWDWIRNSGRSTSVEQLGKELAKSLGQTGGLTPEVMRTDWYAVYQSLSNNVMPLWFLERGFGWKTIEQWDIRYNPITDAVVIPVLWDKKLVGTVTRNTMSNLPKYQNSPNLPRADILFGEIFSSKTEIILCEGVLDTLWLWQLGYNAAGLMGAAVTQKQIEAIRRYRFGEIILALDNDEAGIKGTQEVTKRLIENGWLAPQIKHIQIPVGKKDVQDCSPDEVDKIYEERKDIIFI